MPKQIIYGDELRTKMFSGIEKVAKTVGVTMGPKGRNVILDKGYGLPQVTNDGVTIAREIELEDKFESLGAELVKERASKTNELAGDGTTTATILTYAIAKEGLREIRTGINAVELKNGLKKAGEIVMNELDNISKKITTKEEIAQVASLSAQDNEVGNIIADAMDQVGNNGVISIEDGLAFGLELEITDGMEFDSGYISPYMVTNPEKMLAEFKDAKILITDQKISSMKDLLPLLEQLLGEGTKDLVIIAEDIEGEALTTIILNKLKGVLNILGIKSPGFGDNKKELLKDIAILTGANIITSDLSLKLENASINDLGGAKNIISKNGKTTIIGGYGDETTIKARVFELQNLIKNSNSTYDKEKLTSRVAKLDGGVAVIKVGAASEVEAKEKKLRIEDALNATKAAVEEGVISGGGVALLRASNVLENLDFGNEYQNIGSKIVKTALSYPIKQIVENAGKSGEVIINKIIENNNKNYGYNASNDEYVDMINYGIIDPKKVSRVALEEAISLAGMFLTTESGIVDLPKKEGENNNMPGMGRMPGMGMY
ncbi:chaperonin GroEL [Candidatus Gracilibacteria bacterium]|nr:chaperonin GroEL [Candidatus Gracilibacteria bacterium]